MAFKSILKRCESPIGAGIVVSIFGLAFWGSIPSARAQQNADGELDVIQLRPSFYMIAEPGGGNIAVQTGKDGTILINTGSAEAADRAVAAIKKITDQPIRYIIDTSADSDLVSQTLACGAKHHGDRAGTSGRVVRQEYDLQLFR